MTVTDASISRPLNLPVKSTFAGLVAGLLVGLLLPFSQFLFSICQLTFQLCNTADLLLQ